ncbi:hypothetical protein [Lacunimicrobium album]
MNASSENHPSHKPWSILGRFVLGTVCCFIFLWSLLIGALIGDSRFYAQRFKDQNAIVVQAVKELGIEENTRIGRTSTGFPEIIGTLSRQEMNQLRQKLEIEFGQPLASLVLGENSSQRVIDTTGVYHTEINFDGEAE